MNRQLKVLIVEDNPDDAELLVLELEQAGYDIVYEQVYSAQALQAALTKTSWDVILTDFSMPRFNAIEALKLVKQQALDTPFIVVSGSIGEEMAVELMKTGAHDYLLKQNLIRLVPVVQREIQEAKVRAERKQALEKVEALAFRDQLTGLPNRHALINALQNQIRSAQSDSIFAVIFLDLDQYRTIRYGFGHVKSDQLLVEVANRLKVNLQSEVFLARVGKSEFALLLNNLSDVGEAEAQAAKLHQLIDPPFELDDFVTYASLSIGIVHSTLGFDEPEELLRAAETANHTAKQQSLGNSTVVYTRMMQTEALERLQIETELRQAIRDRQLQLFYQPIVALNPYQVVGFEALIRWQHPTRGWISPAQFIPIAEQTGLIIPLGDWILAEVCRQSTLWQAQLSNYLPLDVSVNLSGVQLNEPEVITRIVQQCQSLDLQQICLKLEITESVLMSNKEAATVSLEQLRTAGVQLCLDDFGTGYSSLSYLHLLPIDTLKVDRSFVLRMVENERDFRIVRAITTLAQTLGLDIVAEGIETRAQLDCLRSLGCNYGQGYLFAKPLPPQQIEDWLSNMSLAT